MDKVTIVCCGFLSYPAKSNKNDKYSIRYKGNGGKLTYKDARFLNFDRKWHNINTQQNRKAKDICRNPIRNY